MSEQSESKPFLDLGGKLKHFRQQKKESVAEAAGAVELAEEDLLRIEEGYERPSEEILMLLIKHFAMIEDEAVRLWELAGYDKIEPEDDTLDTHGAKSIVMTIAMDPRVMYSDSVHITGNEHGLVFTFLQPGGGQLPALPVSRVGMSRDQARKMLELMKDTLDQLDNGNPPKQLPPNAS
jgi:DNA-binding XRE family transcriptional regulator